MANQPAEQILWEPSQAQREASGLRAYQQWLAKQRGLDFADYDALWRWSTDEIEAFWASLWDYFALVSHSPYQTVLNQRTMPGARWFVGAQINYVEHVFRNRRSDQPALIVASEREAPTEWSWAALEAAVGAAAAGLRRLGVGPGDRVVGYLPNSPEALIAFLATASLGAIWSSCSPDFGSPSVIDRFSQIEPSILIAIDGYQYGGKAFDRREAVSAIRAALPSLRHAVLIPALDPQAQLPDWLSWQQLTAEAATLSATPVEFNSPLWVLYSSGTTGLPKPIVHSQGGILIQHLKELRLHFDLGPGKRFFWFTTTGWMMWNLLIGGLLVGATVVLYDGSPAFPDLSALWRLAEAAKISMLGTSAGFITASMKAGVEPAHLADLRHLEALGSTGSPLPPEGFDWIYGHVKRDLWLASVSGGTDVCGCFVGGVPLLAVYRGEIQARQLGVAAEALDSDGAPVIGVMGELVIGAPMPSMPIFFWNDPSGERYHSSYFEHYPGRWRHGDWITINERGGVVIYGRSDSTINRQGVRMGTSEIYRAVEAVPEVLDSLVLDFEGLGGASFMALFVVLREGQALDAAQEQAIKAAIRNALSPRHVPDQIVAVSGIPYTLSGKKLEVPIKKILSGVDPTKAANRDSLRNPELLAEFVGLRSHLRLPNA